MAFKDNLEILPVAEGGRLVLLDETGAESASIANSPGTAGSFQVYAYLAAKYGSLNPTAAQEGLEIYAEHTDDAQLNPGKHPNIDRLLSLLTNDGQLTVYLVSVVSG